MPQAQGGSGLAIAALVLGIVSLVLFCFPKVGLPAAIIAIVLGAIARGKANRGEAGGKGMATAALALSIIAILLLAIAIVAGGWAAKKFGPEFQKAMEQQMTQPSPVQSTKPASPRTMLPTAVWPA
jgi:hypothetical protein